MLPPPAYLHYCIRQIRTLWIPFLLVSWVLREIFLSFLSQSITITGLNLFPPVFRVEAETPHFPNLFFSLWHLCPLSGKDRQWGKSISLAVYSIRSNKTPRGNNQDALVWIILLGWIYPPWAEQIPSLNMAMGFPENHSITVVGRDY